jgi:hypothetical protein
VHNGPTFSGRAGTEPPLKYKDRNARPVRCNGWLSRRLIAFEGQSRSGGVEFFTGLAVLDRSASDHQTDR